MVAVGLEAAVAVVPEPVPPVREKVSRDGAEEALPAAQRQKGSPAVQQGLPPLPSGARRRKVERGRVAPTAAVRRPLPGRRRGHSWGRRRGQRRRVAGDLRGTPRASGRRSQSPSGGRSQSRGQSLGLRSSPPPGRAHREPQPEVPGLCAHGLPLREGGGVRLPHRAAPPPALLLLAEVGGRGVPGVRRPGSPPARPCPPGRPLAAGPCPRPAPPRRRPGRRLQRSAPRRLLPPRLLLRPPPPLPAELPDLGRRRCLCLGGRDGSAGRHPVGPPPPRALNRLGRARLQEPPRPAAPRPAAPQLPPPGRLDRRRRAPPPLLLGAPRVPLGRLRRARGRVQRGGH